MGGVSGQRRPDVNHERCGCSLPLYPVQAVDLRNLTEPANETGLRVALRKRGRRKREPHSSRHAGYLVAVHSTMLTADDSVAIGKS
jgi:hypothetical protein